MPVAFEFWAGGTGGNLGVDIGPCRTTVPFHVLGGDLVRDALIAQSRHQPIEQRRGVVAPDGRGNAFGPQVGANVVDQAGGARQATDTVHHPNSVIDCRCLAAIRISTGLAEPAKSSCGLPFLKSCRQIIATSLRCTSLSPSMYRWVVWIER